MSLPELLTAYLKTRAQLTAIAHPFWIGRRTKQTDFVAKERIINQQNTRCQSDAYSVMGIK
jgi:hypothetical protein